MRPEADCPAARAAAVRACLDAVMDPELDASVAELDFIAELRIAGDAVHLQLRLPTFFCSANFAWIMAEDAQRAIAALPWAGAVTVELVDHFAMHRINPALAAGQGFREAFGREATADLDQVRRDFRDKAFLGRQSVVIDGLRRAGWPAERIVGLSLAQLAALDLSGERARARDSYLAARRAREDAAAKAQESPDLPAFVDMEGRAIAPEGLLDHLRASRRIRGGFEANGEMCRILLAARYAPGGQVEPGQPGQSPAGRDRQDRRREVAHDNG